MFTDVPHLKNQVKRRHWLVALMKRVPFDQKHTFDYLYRIAFIRSGDYLGMYGRLLVIGGLFIYFIPNIWLKLVFAVLFLYMSSFQMVTLYHHHRTVMWLDLYPVGLDVRQRSLVKLLYQLAMIQTVLYAVLFASMQEWIGSLVVLAVGALFIYTFIHGFVYKKVMV